jgi:uncharacterized protein YacL
MLMVLIRVLFLMMVASLGAHYASLVSETAAPGQPASAGWVPMLAFFCTIGGGVLVVVGDVLVRRKQISTISAVYFGVIVGLILSYLFVLALEPTLTGFGTRPELIGAVRLGSMVVLCYLTVSLMLQTKDDFRFIIPFVEFSKEIKGPKPFLLDTSVIIDGRIADICETKIIDNVLVVPRFVLQELQNIADSSDKLRRNRGRRGLDVLNRLQTSEKVEIQMHDGKVPELEGVREVDHQLVLLAKRLSGKVVTNDYNLNKIARLQGVEVVNINDLANALKPVVLPGESMTVKLIKPGEEIGQGIGYLEDGTMVVAEQGKDHIGDDVTITVTSVLQTSAGRMIFGRLDGRSDLRPGRVRR